MKVIINQFQGIGDIIYCQGIAQELIRRGCEVHWPVNGWFLSGLKKAYPDVHFSDMGMWHWVDFDRKDEHYQNGYTIVPLRWADQIMGYSYDNCMRSKYDLIGLDNKDWRKHARPVRDPKAEARLLDIIRGARVDKPYRVSNRHYTSSPNVTAPGVPECEVEMRPVPGFSIFDWIGILEMAEEIHTVSTSLIYLLEAMKFRAKLHLYPRPEDPKFKHIDYLLTPELWTLHPRA